MTAAPFFAPVLALDDLRLVFAYRRNAALAAAAGIKMNSMNTQVTATNMQIKAAVPTQLLIKGSAGGAVYKSAIDFTSNADSAKYQSNNGLTNVPATAYKGRNEAEDATLIDDSTQWKKLTVTGSPFVKDDGTINGGSQTATWDTINPTYFEAAAANSYDSVNSEAIGDYIKDDFTLKLVGEPGATAADQAVKVTITATMTGTGLDGSDAAHSPSPIYQAIHIAFSDGTNLYEFDLGDGAVTYKADGTEAYITISNEDLTAMTTNNQEVAYSLYIWYDGEDADCRNSNAARIDLFTYDFSFHYGA